MQKEDHFTRAAGAAEKETLEPRSKEDKIMGFYERKAQVDELWIYTNEKTIQNVHLFVRREFREGKGESSDDGRGTKSWL